LQAGETLAALRLRHSSASRVPGLTPVQFDMKSERQEARMAEICSDVGCWAEADSVAPMTSPIASNTRKARQELSPELHQEPHVTQTSLFAGGTLHNRAAAVQHARYCHSAVALRLAA
jgi:hypothetical protein